MVLQLLQLQLLQFFCAIVYLSEKRVIINYYIYLYIYINIYSKYFFSL